MCMFVSFVPLGLKCFSREESVIYVFVSSLPFHLISTRMLWLGEGCYFIASYNPSSHLFVFFLQQKCCPFYCYSSGSNQSWNAARAYNGRIHFPQFLAWRENNHWGLLCYSAVMPLLSNQPIRTQNKFMDPAIGAGKCDWPFSFSADWLRMWQSASIAICSCYYMEPIHSCSPPLCCLSAKKMRGLRKIVLCSLWIILVHQRGLYV